MKRLMLSLAILSLSLGSTPAHAEPVSVKMSLGSCPIGHPLLKAGEDLDAWIREKTNDKYAVTLLPTGTIGNFDTVFQSVQMGSVPLSVETVSNMSNFFPNLAVFDLPYLFRSDESIEHFLRSETIRNLMADMQKKSPGITVIGFNNTGFRCLASSKQVLTLTELQGLKDRISANKLHVAAIKAMGLNRTTTAASEFVSALQQGVVDSTDVEIFWVQTARLFDIVKNYLKIDAMPVLYMTIASNTWLNKLPAEDQAIWKEGLVYFTEQADKRIAEGLDSIFMDLKEKGCIFSEFSDADKQAAAEKTRPVWDTIRPNQKEFLEHVLKELQG